MGGTGLHQPGARRRFSCCCFKEGYFSLLRDTLTSSARPAVFVCWSFEQPRVPTATPRWDCSRAARRLSCVQCVLRRAGHGAGAEDKAGHVQSEAPGAGGEAQPQPSACRCRLCWLSPECRHVRGCRRKRGWKSTARSMQPLPGGSRRGIRGALQLMWLRCAVCPNCKNRASKEAMRCNPTPLGSLGVRGDRMGTPPSPA